MNQFNNPANPLAHETTTAPEIWRQCDARLDAVVCGVGSGGTLTGLSRFFSRTAPHVEMVLADPVGSVLADYVRTGKVGEAGSWLVEGIGEDFIPGIADLSARPRSVPDFGRREFSHCPRIVAARGTVGRFIDGHVGRRRLGLLPAAGEAKARGDVCLRLGQQVSLEDVQRFLDGRSRTPTAAASGDLRDLISRRFADRAVVAVGPDEPLNIAYTRMRLFDVSQLPVLQGDHIVGIIDESDLLLAVTENESAFQQPVHRHMTSRLETVSPDASLQQLRPILASGRVVIVADETRLLRIDYPRRFVEPFQTSESESGGLRPGERMGTGSEFAAARRQ